MALAKAHQDLVSKAMEDVRAAYPDKSEEEYQRALSRLKTAVKCKVRKGVRHWSLMVPELKMKFVISEPA